ncbi:MAG TPA: PAS domain S-box protein [Aquabacterium sp.]|uniref:PAS domain-containing sensor histidine kinase n=1 Tax=Aquabacterium sp. TaxID=1872578 RepID=UPI002E337D53|nr:PAS domain S-box protein [Aquabacterium sp.]HEX5356610.1 PAS domain S-box protein [Aquabacterium sp.]
MAAPSPLHVEDAWFDLVPLALIEFNEHGRVLRANSALSALLGYAIPPGSALSDTPQALQRLCGWDSPLTLLALGPEDGPIQNQVTQPRQASTPVHLRSQIWTQAQPNQDAPRRFLCAIKDSVPATAAPAAPVAISSITSDADAAPLPDQAQLLHELSTILESTPAGIAYFRDNVLLRCNRRFERMLGLTPGSMAGQGLEVLLGADPRIDRVVTETATELMKSEQFESELEIVIPGNTTRWYTLSVRRIGLSNNPLEVIAVLSDISRIRSQQAQLESLGRDRDLMFTLSGVGIAFVKDGLIQSANPALSHLIGEDAANLTGRPLISVYALDVDNATDPDITGMLRSLGHWQGERPLRSKKGRVLWADVSLRLVDPQRPEEGFIASFVNVDDRHRAEQRLTLQADRTRAILDSVFVGIVTLDEHGIAWMNRSARRMFAGDLADFVGQPLATVATPDLDHPFRLTDYLDDLLDGQSHTFECQVVGRDGRMFWVVGNAVVTLGEGNRRHITYALLDIDRRRQAEAQSAEAQARLQRIIEMAPMAIHLIDARQLTLVQANQAASGYMNIEPAKAVGKPPEALYDADRARLLRADMQQALDSGQSVHREYSRPHKGSQQFWDVNYLPLSREGEVADQLLVVASDITEQRAAEQARLDAAIAQREMLVKEVHHRIKNNLQGVAGLLQQIAMRKPEVAPAISEVVGQVQAIAQVYGLQVGAGGPLRLKAVVEAIAASVQRTFGRPITLAMEGTHAGDWQLPEAESIPIALCLNELLTNAHKHGPGTSTLACTLLSSEQGVSIRIRSPGQLPPGFNVDRVPGGVSGLGLVRALLPRRSAKLALKQEGTEVLTQVDLTPPGINLIPPPHVLGEPTGQQIALWPQ